MWLRRIRMILAMVLGMLTLTGCPVLFALSGMEKTYEDSDFSFRYSTNWSDKTEETNAAYLQGTPSSTAKFKAVLRADTDLGNFFISSVSLTTTTFNQEKLKLTLLTLSAVASTDILTSGPRTIDGCEGYGITYRTTANTSEKYNSKAYRILTFKDQRFFLIGASYATLSSRAASIEAEIERMISSIRLK